MIHEAPSDLHTAEKLYDRIWQDLLEATLEAGGTISHHHGIGKDHLPYLEAEKGPIGINTLNQVFSYLDPNRQMNPGKLLP